MIPHDYQAEAVDVAVSSLHERNLALVIMATGLGKTLVAASTYKRFKGSKRQLRNLLLCHDNDILEQSEPTFRAVLGEKANIGYFNGETKDGRDAEIVFSTFQTLRDWKHVFSPDEFGLIIVDEAHHSQAATFKDVIEHFSASRLGITAIRDRMDGKDIAQLFGEPVYNLPLEEAIPRGLLTPFEYRIVSDGLSTATVREITREIESGKRFTLNDVNKRLFITARDEEIVRRIQREAGTRKTLVFCRNIRHADRVAEMIGRAARGYHSGATRAVNRDSLAGFRAGNIQFLVAVNKANEGVDIPDAEVVVFLRATDSKTIFFEQLGRSLRKFPGKTKALILDFVGNIERVMMLRDIIRKIGEHLGVLDYEDKRLVSVSGDDFEFNFSDTIVEALNLVTVIRRDFYPTWQEASAAAQRLGIRAQREYHRKYRDDPKLPSAPEKFYGVTMAEFLGKKPVVPRERDPKGFYKTWQEASNATLQLGIHGQKEFKRRYQEDPRLPSNPHVFYRDFPSWRVFLGKGKLYATAAEASAVAIRLGIKTQPEYRKRRKVDLNLPAAPEVYYRDSFPGWISFLGRKKVLKPVKAKVVKQEKYGTWQEAAEAVKRLGIKDENEYARRYKEDPKLPGSLFWRYEDLRSWREFMGEIHRDRKDYYKTVEEAIPAAKALGATSVREYKRVYKRDPKLPASPDKWYGVTLTKFFGKEPKTLREKDPKGFYQTWQKAGTAAVALGLSTAAQYKESFKKDRRLPANPEQFYENFPGYTKFFGRQPRRKPYRTWQQASAAAKRLLIMSHEMYRQRYKEDPKLPASPGQKYPDFPGYRRFLGKT